MSWFPLEHCSLPQSSKFWPNYVPPECCRGVPRPIWIIRDTQRTSKVHSCWRQRPENNVKVVQLCLDFLLKSWSRPTNGQFGPNWMPPGCCMGAPWPLWVIRNTQGPCKSIVVEDKGQTKVKGHPTRSWFAWSDDDPNHIISGQIGCPQNAIWGYPDAFGSWENHKDRAGSLLFKIKARELHDLPQEVFHNIFVHKTLNSLHIIKTRIFNISSFETMAGSPCTLAVICLAAKNLLGMTIFCLKWCLCSLKEMKIIT